MFAPAQCFIHRSPFRRALLTSPRRYTRQSRSVSPVKSTLAAPIQSLMQLIFNQQYMNEAMSALNYDAEKMPLGKLSKATINRGFQTLKELAALLQGSIASHGEVEELSNRYYSLIPHNFGRYVTPVVVAFCVVILHWHGP